jgi:hypothetical protein
MCLVTNQLKPTTIRKDRKVWVVRRVEEEVLCSPFMRTFIWIEGKEYETSLDIPKEPFPKMEVYRGFHSFANKENAEALAISLNSGSCFDRRNGGSFIVRGGIIPKGSKVYTGKTSRVIRERERLSKLINNVKGYVSNRLITCKE